MGHFKSIFPTSLASHFLHVTPIWALLYRLAGFAHLTGCNACSHVIMPSSFVPSKSAVIEHLCSAQSSRSTVSDELPRLSEQEHWWLQHIIHIAGKLFWQKGIPWWVSHGSLLGAARHKGPIPHDQDGDIDIFLNDIEALQDTSLRSQLSCNGILITGPSSSQWIYNLKPLGKEMPHVDVHLVVQSSDGLRLRYVSHPKFHRQLHWLRPSHWVMLPFGSIQVVAPNNYPDYLISMYGHDWNETMRVSCRADRCTGSGTLHITPAMRKRSRLHLNLPDVSL